VIVQTCQRTVLVIARIHPGGVCWYISGAASEAVLLPLMRQNCRMLYCRTQDAKFLQTLCCLNQLCLGLFPPAQLMTPLLCCLLPDRTANIVKAATALAMRCNMASWPQRAVCYLTASWFHRQQSCRCAHKAMQHASRRLGAVC
jgi:hypothetical protein